MKEIDLLYLTAFRETLRGRLVVALVELAKTEDHLHQDSQRKTLVNQAANLRTRLSYVDEAMRHVDAAPSES